MTVPSKCASQPDTFLAPRRAAGLSLCLTAETSALAQQVDRLLDQGFQWDSSAGEPAQDDAASDSTLRIDFHVRMANTISLAADEIAERVQLHAEGTRATLHFGYANVQLDTADKHAAIALSAQFWTLPLKLQQEVVILTFLWLAQGDDRFALHATAVSGPRGLVLLAGNSGSGKSTTAMSLINAGWSFLADDVVLFTPRARHFQFWGLPRGFAFSHDLLRRMPALAAIEPAHLWDLGEKMFGLIDTVFPRSLTTSAEVAGILFPVVRGGGSSRLQRLATIDAVAALIGVSGGILTSIAQAQAQLKAIGRLAQAVPAFRLDAGPDVYCKGEAINRLFMAHGLA